MPLSTEDLQLLFPHKQSEPVEHAVFRLARFIKFNRGLIYQLERPQVKNLIANWMIVAVTHFPPDALDLDDVTEMIKTACVKAAYPLGVDLVADAVQQAIANPDYPPAPPEYGETHYLIFRCVYWMNVAAIKRLQPTWFLSSYALAKALGKRQTIIHRAFQRLQKDYYIVLSEKGNQYRANRYETQLVTVQ